jgi:hypothetical protein
MTRIAKQKEINSFQRSHKFQLIIITILIIKGLYLQTMLTIGAIRTKSPIYIHTIILHTETERSKSSSIV